MKKIFLLSALLAAVAGTVCAGVAFWLLQKPQREWTTDSRKALKEFEHGLERLRKMSRTAAAEHFEEALRQDGSFAMAKLHLMLLARSAPERQRLAKEIQQIEPGALTARERFLLSYHLARGENRREDAAAVLAAFLEHSPDDPYAIRLDCKSDWEAQRWDDAERCYDHLLALYPDWVEARNNLGYIAMARGRFDEAEERFRTYRYLTPDEAVPYHSLAVLLTVRGRYDEAEKELDEALSRDEDLCAAYTQGVEVGLMSGRLERSRQALGALESREACGYLEELGVVCALDAWALYLEGDAEGAWRRLDGACLEQRDGFDLLAHRIAVMTERLDRATLMEETLRVHRDQVAAEDRRVDARFLSALLAHMDGIRALASKDFARAVEQLSEADGLLGYWGGERASIKLFNRVNLWRALQNAGDLPRAKALRRELDDVNPELADGFALPDVDILRQFGDSGLPASFGVREEQNQ